MVKLTVLALIFTALTTFTSVSGGIITRILTTTDDEGRFVVSTENRFVVSTTMNGEQQSCLQEIRREKLTGCQKHLVQNSPYDGDVLEMTVVDPRKEKEKKQLGECCMELRSVKEECQCEAVQEVYQQAAEHQWEGGSRDGSQQVKQHRQILQKAQRLPSECQLKVQQCSIRSPWI